MTPLKPNQGKQHCAQAAKQRTSTCLWPLAPGPGSGAAHCRLPRSHTQELDYAAKDSSTQDPSPLLVPACSLAASLRNISQRFSEHAQTARESHSRAHCQCGRRKGVKEGRQKHILLPKKHVWVIRSRVSAEPWEPLGPQPGFLSKA